MNTRPLVSVCIPVFNGLEFLREAIESAQHQTYHNMEILVSDDNSTDGSVDLVLEMAQSDSRIRLIRNNNRLGLVGNWNRCVLAASGNWVKFLFQDDLLGPDCVEKLLNSVSDQVSTAGIAFCRRRFIFEEGEAKSDIGLGLASQGYIWDEYPAKAEFSIFDVVGLLEKWPGKNPFGEPTSFLIHKSVFEKIGLFDSDFHNHCDIEFWLRACVNTKIVHLPEVLVSFRVHGASTTSVNNREKWFHIRYVERTKLYLRFLYGKHYKPLRDHVRGWPSSMYLMSQAAIYFRRFRIDAEKMGEQGWLDEYDRLARTYPEVDDCSRTVFAGLALRYFLAKMAIKYL